MFAGAITVDGTWYQFLFDGPGTFAHSCGGGCNPTSNPIADATQDAPWTFNGAATLSVLDLFTSGDQFEVFDNGNDLGPTSSPGPNGLCAQDIGCALADSNYSFGAYSLGSGAHSITIQELKGQGGAAVLSASVPTESSGAPEPATFVALGSGLLALAGSRRLRKI
jgi:hypothetical protein